MSLLALNPWRPSGSLANVPGIRNPGRPSVPAPCLQTAEEGNSILRTSGWGDLSPLCCTPFCIHSHIHICTCVHTCILTHLHSHCLPIPLCTFTCVHVCTCTYTPAGQYTHLFMNICTQDINRFSWTQLCAHTHICTARVCTWVSILCRYVCVCVRERERERGCAWFYLTRVGQ